MKRLLFLFLFASCAHQTPALIDRPVWVEAVRNGEEGLRFLNGNKILYRRIAGSSALSKEASCELAVAKVEEDIRKEFPRTPQLPYNIEILVYDREHSDCAVTASVSEHQPEFANVVPKKNESLSADEVTDLLRQRAELAIQYAQVGLTKDEFEKYTQDKVRFNDSAGECERVFRAPAYSIHGTTQVCWKGEHVVGYCTTSACWTKTP